MSAWARNLGLALLVWGLLPGLHTTVRWRLALPTALPAAPAAAAPRDLVSLPPLPASAATGAQRGLRERQALRLLDRAFVAAGRDQATRSFAFTAGAGFVFE